MNKQTKISFILFFSTLLIYFTSSPGHTPHNYFIHLAQSFTRGQYWLETGFPWLNELIPYSAEKYFVPYPPMPAILLVPFLTVFGITFPQEYLAHLLGAAITVLTFKLSFSIKKNLKIALSSSILIGFGSIIWFLSSVGSAWYLGQITAAFFLFLALVESHQKKRPALVALFLGAAYLSRLHTILSLPLFLFLLKKRLQKPIPLITFFIPLLAFIAFNFTYNFIRFGTILDKGYVLIPGVLNEPWYQNGLFHYSYIPRHLKAIFLTFPKLLSQPPFIQPSLSGLAIWITTPAFIFSLFAPFKKPLSKMLWITILLISIPIFTHGTTGFAQFGYRFAVDFYPFLTLLTIQGIAHQKGPRQFHWLLIFIGILVNLWGVLWINKFGFTSY